MDDLDLAPCPLCGSKAYTHIQARGPDGKFKDGPLIRCVECRHVRGFAPAPPKVAGGAEIDRLEALMARATQGPYRVGRTGFMGTGVLSPAQTDETGPMIACWGSTAEGLDSEANAALIVAVVNALPGLIATIRTQAAELAALKAARPSVQHVDTMNDRVLMEMARDAALNKGGDHARS